MKIRNATLLAGLGVLVAMSIPAAKAQDLSDLMRAAMAGNYRVGNFGNDPVAIQNNITFGINNLANQIDAAVMSGQLAPGYAADFRAQLNQIDAMRSTGRRLSQGEINSILGQFASMNSQLSSLMSNPALQYQYGVGQPYGYHPYVPSNGRYSRYRF